MGPHLDTHQTVSIVDGVEMPAMPVTDDKHNKRSDECFYASLSDLVTACRRGRVVYILMNVLLPHGCDWMPQMC